MKASRLAVKVFSSPMTVGSNTKLLCDLATCLEEKEFLLLLMVLAEMTGSELNGAKRITNLLYDHRPSPLSEDDYIRVCLIPKTKRANFRDLLGVIVGTDNVAQRDRTQEQQFLPSGKPLVPDYVFTLKQGKSKRPFARLWWDETMPDCSNCTFLSQPGNITSRARPASHSPGMGKTARYCQIGNAVAVPVGRALGYTMGMAFQKGSGNEPLMILPPKFSLSTNIQLAKSLSQNTDRLN
ncbi:hypothetical protein J1N35_010393 [Gossypium stocksii]|uniref:Uncharacterized protein n=1 Tax=Gossypium stocksii TaxID=47602 RepID=A0A9D3W258_9ROSI|nr:hypothetical protein J1N35_010393 [Gossypium stocksii]